MRTAVVEMLAVTQRAAHPSQFRGPFEQEKRNARATRVECQAQARRAAAEDRQWLHRPPDFTWPDLVWLDFACRNFIRLISGQSAVGETSSGSASTQLRSLIEPKAGRVLLTAIIAGRK